MRAGRGVYPFVFKLGFEDIYEDLEEKNQLCFWDFLELFMIENKVRVKKKGYALYSLSHGPGRAQTVCVCAPDR